MKEIKDMEITYTEEQKNPKNTKLQGSMEWSGCLENVKVSNVLKSIKESEFIIEFTGKLKQPIPDILKKIFGDDIQIGTNLGDCLIFYKGREIALIKEIAIRTTGFETQLKYNIPIIASKIYDILMEDKK